MNVASRLHVLSTQGGRLLGLTLRMLQILSRMLLVRWSIWGTWQLN
jgi:hypothetical protein